MSVHRFATRVLYTIRKRESGCIMDSKRKNINGIKSLIRSLEGILEITLLTLLYYLVWRYGYEQEDFPTYYGYGKYVLAGVYFLLVLVLFHSFDGFKFGYLRMADALISQWIALFIGNFLCQFF